MGDIGGFSVNGNSVRLPQIPGRKPSANTTPGSMQLVVQQPQLVRGTSAQNFVVHPSITSAVETSSEKSILRLPSYQVKSQNTKPIGMQRAKMWTIEVENSYRYQLAGFKDESEYLQMYPPPEHWPNGGMIKCLNVKSTEFFMYFRQTRECLDKHVNKVKIYQF